MLDKRITIPILEDAAVKYTTQMVEFIRAHSSSCTLSQLHAIFCNSFGCDVSIHGLRAKVRALGLEYVRPKPRYSRTFPQDVVEFIRDNAHGMPNSILAQMVTDSFGVEITREQVKSIKRQMCVRSGLGTAEAMWMSRPEGWVNPLKGRKVSPQTYEKIKKTFFRKGENGRRRTPVGTEVMRGGRIMVKIAEPSTWMTKARLVYERETGETLEDNEIVIFLDGNRQNFSIDNLMMAHKGEVLEGYKICSAHYNSDMTRATILTARLRRMKRRLIQAVSPSSQKEGSDASETK